MASLRVFGPDHIAREVELTGKECVLGRASHVAIRLQHESVSREHAALLHEESGWLVEDRGSTQGTRVNGKAVPDNACVEAQILWPSGKGVTLLGEVAGEVTGRSHAYLCLKLHRVEGRLYELAVMNSRRGAWVEVPHVLDGDLDV